MTSFLESEQYSFIKEDEHLGDNVLMLCYGGSHAYGTNVEGSDVDLRGITANRSEDLLGIGSNFEQYEDKETDTVIYSFNKYIKLLLNSNPAAMEMLGCREEDYFYQTDIFKDLKSRKDWFLSQQVIKTFGGYANAQLRRLDNKAMRSVSQTEQEKHILNSIKSAENDYRLKFFEYPEDSIRLYVDTAVSDDKDSEIFMDVNLTHYPLRDYKGMWSSMNNIVKDYGKIGHRNKEAASYGKLGKHMMHLVRLYYMLFDILEKGEIITYREDEHDMLMDIRNGKYLDDNNQPIDEFFEFVQELENRLTECKRHTKLPLRPNYNKIQQYVIMVNGWSSSLGVEVANRIFCNSWRY